MSRASRTPTHRPRRPLVALASRLAGHPRALGFATLAVLAFVTWVIVLSVNGVPFQQRYALVVELPDDAVPVDAADQVRIAGQRAGMVKSARPVDGGNRVEIEVLPDFWPIGDETTARVRVRPASGLTFLELRPDGDEALDEGSTIVRANVTSGTTLPEAAETFDAATRDALAGTLRTGGAAVLSQGESLNAAARQLPRVLDEGVPVVGALTPEDGELAGLMTGSQRIARGLAGDGRDLPVALADTSVSLQAVARRREDLAATIDRAAPLLSRLDAVSPELDALMTQLTQLTRDVTPATEALAAELPVLRRALASSPELRRAAAKLGPAAADALDRGPEAMYSLHGPISLLGPTVEQITAITDVLSAYRADLLAGVKGLEAVTTKTYAEGFTAPGHPGLRFGPVFTCGTPRNPYPAPGTSRQDAGERGQC